MTTYERELHIFAVGDIMLAGAAQTYLDTYGYDYPFRQIQPFFEPADLICGNLEVPLTCHTAPLVAKKRYVYQAHPEASAKALREFGFDLLCLANNHILDYGSVGLEETQAVLATHGIRYFGAGLSYQEAIAAQVVELAGVRIGFLGFMQRYRTYREYKNYFARGENPGVAPLKKQTVQEAIAALKSRVDLVIVNCHWGRNYKPVTNTQKKWGKRLVDFGADLVIGHHPHIPQGVEIYQGVPIIYSLGNFTFCTPGRFQKVPPLWCYGQIADIALAQGRIVRLDLIPIAVDNRIVHFQPQVATPEVLHQLLSLLNQEFETPMEIVKDRLRLWLPKSTGYSRDVS